MTVIPTDKEHYEATGSRDVRQNVYADDPADVLRAVETLLAMVREANGVPVTLTLVIR